MAKRLILFDIDGTLVLTGRAGVRALDRAVTEVFGHDRALDGIEIAGRTDRAIVSDVLRKIARDASDAAVAEVRDRYVALLPEEVARVTSHPKHVLPGVAEALDALAPLEGAGEVVVALLTGNFVRGAEIKLGYFDLWTRFPFGAFGDDHANRRDLVPVALAAAARAGHGAFAPADVVIVGDTPADVDCAHAHGAMAVAVATGGYDEVALRATGADVTVPTLRDWKRIWLALESQ